MRKPEVIEGAANRTTAPEQRAPGRPRSKRAADEFDTAIGRRIRAARLAANMSLASLGQAVGIAHQQVYKYEAGNDRVAASMLQRIALVLKMHPGSFFDDDVPMPGERVPDMAAQLRFSGDLQRIARTRVRKQRLGSAEACTEQDGVETGVPSGGRETASAVRLPGADRPSAPRGGAGCPSGPDPSSAATRPGR